MCVHMQEIHSALTCMLHAQVMQSNPKLWPILVDPQTGGGLLGAVPWEQAEACVQVGGKIGRASCRERVFPVV